MAEKYQNIYSGFKTQAEAEEYVEKQDIWFRTAHPGDYDDYRIRTKVSQNAQYGFVGEFTAER